MRVAASPDTAIVAAGAGRPSAGRRTTSAWHLLAVCVATLAIGTSVGPLGDRDIFWHVAVGNQLLQHGRLPVPDPWAYTLTGTVWHPTAWLSEVLLAVTQRALGYRGIALLVLLLGAVLLFALHRLLRPARPAARTVVFVLAVASLWPYLQERPQLLSLVFVVWLAGLAQRIRRDPAALHLVRTVLLTYVWANVHGLWVLVPVVLVLVLVGGLLDGSRTLPIRRLGLTAGCALVAAAATPVGPWLLVSPVVVARAARGQIVEWHPVVPISFPVWGFLGLVVLIVAGWVRGGRRPPVSEVLWVAAFVLFGLTAWRNVGPAVILLAPFALAGLDRMWARQPDYQIGLTGVGLVGALAAVGVVAAALQVPLTPRWAPTRIAATLRADHTSLRVLDDYNLGGYLIAFGGARHRVAIDGRADRYGAAFIDRYTDMTAGRPGWQVTVTSLRPDVAVLEAASPLPELLVRSLGWRVVQRDNRYVLLARPGLALRPA